MSCYQNNRIFGIVGQNTSATANSPAARLAFAEFEEALAPVRRFERLAPLRHVVDDTWEQPTDDFDRAAEAEFRAAELIRLANGLPARSCKPAMILLEDGRAVVRLPFGQDLEVEREDSLFGISLLVIDAPVR